MHKTFRIEGQVIDTNTGQPAPDVLVEAWDKDMIYDDFVGSAITDENGAFVIEFSQLFYMELFTDHWPDLYFKVYSDGDLIANTQDSVLWNVTDPVTAVTIQADVPASKMDVIVVTRNIYLKIETIDAYSPVEPQDKVAPPMQYRRDCMRNTGHEDGTIPDSEVEARRIKALVYREYLDANYLIPKVDKLIQTDINEPTYTHRVPGTVIYTRPGERLRIHVFNADTEPHSLHVHGLEYGVDSDGAWPFGTQNTNGQRSDEICPGQKWIYTFHVRKTMVGAWPFHDHAQHPGMSINRGLFGGIVVLPEPAKPPPPFEIPDFYVELVERFGPKGDQRRVVRLRREDRIYLHNTLDFLDEWLTNRFALPPRELPELHVPVFFHLMSGAEAKPLFDSGDIEELVGFFEHTFNEEGSFDYFCQFHPIMQGTVDVTAGGPMNVTVNIVDGPPMAFAPAVVTVGVGGTVRWENHSIQHHTATSEDGASLPTHCINGRGFVGNTPTIVGRAGQKIHWYVFSLDLSSEIHNFHPHAQRWQFADESHDVRSLSPAESFVVETEVPPVILMTDEIEAIQAPKDRPDDAQLYHLKADYVFHCHVHHHMQNGMIGLVRAKQSVWLTPAMVAQIEQQTGLPVDDGSNACPDVDLDRCKKQGAGKWEEIPGEPEVTFMHSVLLPSTDKVLYWGYTDANQSRLWDYSTPAGSYSSPANQPASLPGLTPTSSDIWSAEHAHLDTPQGLVLVNGGFTPDKAFTFDPATETWTQVQTSADDRFYSTTLTLADGRAITLFGSASKSHEIYTHGVGWSAPVNFPVNYHHHQYYPWSYLLPDGRIFIAGPHDPTHRFDVNDPTLYDEWYTVSGDRSSGGEKGTSVMLTLRPPNYEPRVIVAGGDMINGPYDTGVTTEIIDLSQPAPAWTQLPDLNVKRALQFTAVLLPDGSVFVAGGVSGADGGPCEIYDPQNPADGWQLGPTMNYVRAYHSSIILLADGSIVAGGDPKGPGGVITPHERYYPGYYYQARPAISNAPPTINYGGAFTIDSPQAADINEVILLRPGAVTHGFNMGQRAVECVITGGTAATIDSVAPPDGNVAPPGWYLLFILDSGRVPSVGRWIRLTP